MLCLCYIILSASHKRDALISISACKIGKEIKLLCVCNMLTDSMVEYLEMWLSSLSVVVDSLVMQCFNVYLSRFYNAMWNFIPAEQRIRCFSTRDVPTMLCCCRCLALVKTNSAELSFLYDKIRVMHAMDMCHGWVPRYCQVPHKPDVQ